jgi:hypothetical protein
MKQFGLRYLYKHLGEALTQMPFEITNHNRVVAVVTSPFWTIGKEDVEGDFDLNPLIIFKEKGQLFRVLTEDVKLEVFDRKNKKWREYVSKKYTSGKKAAKAPKKTPA